MVGWQSFSMTFGEASFWPSTLIEWTTVGSTIFAALAATVTLYIINAKTLEAQWNDSFRRLYDEFWHDDLIREARRYIAFDRKYDEIKDLLQRLVREADQNLPSGSKASIYSEEELDICEAIDRFCSKCIQITFVRETVFFSGRQRQFKALFFQYWARQYRRRSELREYMKSYWPSLAFTFEKYEAPPAG